METKQKIEVILTIKPGSSPLEIFNWFKELEKYSNERFLNVTDFSCVKKHHSDTVTMTFYHDGEKNKAIKWNL